MARIDRYMLSQFLTLFGFFALVLVSIYWINRAVALFEQLIQDGQTALVVLEFTALTLPLVISLVLPVAAFAATAYGTNRLASESELAAMQAAGLSPWRLARPALVFGLIAGLMVAALVHGMVPLARERMAQRQSQIAEDLTARLLRAGTFQYPADGITLFIRRIAPDGRLLDLFLEDARNPREQTLYTAEEALVVRTDAGPRLVMRRGMAQTRSAGPEGGGDASPAPKADAPPAREASGTAAADTFHSGAASPAAASAAPSATTTTIATGGSAAAPSAAAASDASATANAAPPPAAPARTARPGTAETSPPIMGQAGTGLPPTGLSDAAQSVTALPGAALSPAAPSGTGASPPQPAPREPRASPARPLLAVTRFETLGYDLGGLIPAEDGRSRDLRSYSTPRLLLPDAALLGATGASAARARAVAHERLAQPLSAPVAAMLGFSLLMLGGFSRFGVWRQVIAAIVALLAVQALATAAASRAAAEPGAWPLLYAAPLAGAAVSAAALWWAGRPRRQRRAAAAP